MPKLKTRGAVKKRLKISKTGKVLRRHTRMNHFLQKKSAARKRRLRQTDVITGKQAKSIKRQLGL